MDSLPSWTNYVFWIPLLVRSVTAIKCGLKHLLKQRSDNVSSTPRQAENPKVELQLGEHAAVRAVDLNPQGSEFIVEHVEVGHTGALRATRITLTNSPNPPPPG